MNLVGGFVLNIMPTSCNDHERLKTITIFNLLVRFCTELAVSPRLVNAELRQNPFRSGYIPTDGFHE